MTVTSYESEKINTRELSEQLFQCHGGAFNPLMHGDGHLEGVLTFGPPGIGKTQSVLAAAKRIAKSNGMELVIYKPGIRPDPSKKQCLFVHMSMAGMTSGRIAGFPTVGAEDRPATTDTATPEDKEQQQRRYVSRQVIPALWRTAMEFDSAIYLFDEITHVVSQEAMLSLLSEGFYEETKMARRALFIATANEGVADGTLQQKLSTAFRNRFTSYYIRGDVKQWRQDFANAVVHPAALAYASVYADRFENFKAPENNLLNLPTLRGLTFLAENLTIFEALNFRELSEDGMANPKGAMREDVSMTPEHEKILHKLAFGRLGNQSYAQDFVTMYSLAFKTVIPEIRKTIAGKFKEMNEDFKAALAQDSEAALARQKNNVKGKGSDERLRESQNDIAKAFTYVDYVPRMYLETLEGLPKNPRIKEDAKRRHAEKKDGKAWPADDSVPPEMLRGYGNALIDNFLKAIMLLPSNMRMMAIHHLRELSSAPEMKERLKPFDIPGTSGGGDVTMSLLMNHLSTKINDPEYSRLYEAFKENTKAQAVVAGLGS